MIENLRYTSMNRNLNFNHAVF